MKKSLYLTVLLLFFSTTLCLAQFNFGINIESGMFSGKSLALNAADYSSFDITSGQLSDYDIGISGYVGYQLNTKFTPYLELQYYNSGFETIDIEEGAAGDFINSKASIIIPEIGIKYWFNTASTLSPYLNVSFFMPFITLTEETSDPEYINDDLEFINSNLSIWGACVGFGIEYFWDPSFSIGGEYGIRGMSGSHTETYEDNDGLEYNLHYVPTYGKLSVNYYF